METGSRRLRWQPLPGLEVSASRLRHRDGPRRPESRSLKGYAEEAVVASETVPVRGLYGHEGGAGHRGERRGRPRPATFSPASRGRRGAAAPAPGSACRRRRRRRRGPSLALTVGNGPRAPPAGGSNQPRGSVRGPRGFREVISMMFPSYIWMFSAKFTSEVWASFKCWLKFVLAIPMFVCKFTAPNPRLLQVLLGGRNNPVSNPSGNDALVLTEVW